MNTTSSTISSDNYYFDIEALLEMFPDFIIYIAIGGRSGGKTYGSLKYMLLHRKKFVFVKRCIEDVKILCAGNTYGAKAGNEHSVDLSPMAPLNRDFEKNIRAFSIPNVPALGAFFPCDKDNVPEADAIGYIAALNGVHKFKGFDLSECDFIIFDEFIPQQWERVNRLEGEQLMNLYKTVARDREHRGRPPLKIILLANAEEISNPVFNTLELSDTVADMQIQGRNLWDDPERGIVIYRVKQSKQFTEKESASKIYAAMRGTAWAAVSLGNDFANNDFTAVKKVDLRKYKVRCMFIFKHKKYYIYYNETNYYISKRANGHIVCDEIYDLSREMEAERFYYDIVSELRFEAIENRILFESFTLYDLITNFKKYFRIGEHT